ncbi:MAG: molybdopterin-dependent oxidoreductase [Pseudomonadota bacterium]
MTWIFCIPERSAVSDLSRSLTSSHWGIGLIATKNGQITDVQGHPTDPDPSHLNHNIPQGLSGRARVLQPAIREGWRDGRKGERGRDRFVQVSWDEALDHIASELTRVKHEHGNESIFGGSYGWASAGRFHHAQSQLKRFLNTIGGFVRSEGNYSYNAALEAMPHFVGGSYRQHVVEATRWSVIAEHSKLVVLFGGLPMRNMQICDGGASRHRMADNLKACVDKGVRFVNISPLRSDVDAWVGAEWLAPKPGSDTAIMLALAHTLVDENLHDQAFLDRYTVGADRFIEYLQGRSDGVVKSPEWAAEISGLRADRIRSLAREMASQRSMVACAAGLQRADWGEQVLWACVSLAALLGTIGLPGGGYTIGYGVNAHIGNITRPFRWGHLPQGDNPVKPCIPVAMISEMLLNPGQAFRHNGKTLTFPDIRLLWWAGGNPFHHHQDLNRLRTAFQCPETVIVNEINWTATARHADIVLPVASAQERTDFGGGQTDNILVPMPKAVEPPGQARVEYEIFRDLARKLGTEAVFSEGRDEAAWLREMWSETQDSARNNGVFLPNWDSFITGDIVELADPAPGQVFLSEFRQDPDVNSRQTPSGRIELFSETVEGFGLEECQGHATWVAPRDWAVEDAKRYPLALISGQPNTRLHSQYDNGAVSRSAKISGREPVLINPKDAASRNIFDGDIVVLFNARGRCLAGARVTSDIAEGSIFLWTGAWYDPDFDAPDHCDLHGNPNTLTHDLRTSEFSQSPAAHSARIEIQKYSGTPKPVRVHEPPVFVERTQSDEAINGA